MLRKTLMALLLTCSALGAACAAEREDAAREAVLSFLALVDAGDYSASWREMAGHFKAQIGQEQWAEFTAASRMPLGAVKTRRLSTVTPRTNPPGARPGDYFTFVFETEFEEKANAVETVMPMFDDGVWRVSSYFIR